MALTSPPTITGTATAFAPDGSVMNAGTAAPAPGSAPATTDRDAADFAASPTMPASTRARSTWRAEGSVGSKPTKRQPRMRSPSTMTTPARCASAPATSARAFNTSVRLDALSSRRTPSTTRPRTSSGLGAPARLASRAASSARVRSVSACTSPTRRASTRSASSRAASRAESITCCASARTLAASSRSAFSRSAAAFRRTSSRAAARSRAAAVSNSPMNPRISGSDCSRILRSSFSPDRCTASSSTIVFSRL